MIHTENQRLEGDSESPIRKRRGRRIKEKGEVLHLERRGVQLANHLRPVGCRGGPVALLGRGAPRPWPSTLHLAPWGQVRDGGSAWRNRLVGAARKDPGGREERTNRRRTEAGNEYTHAAHQSGTLSLSFEEEGGIKDQISQGSRKEGAGVGRRKGKEGAGAPAGEQGPRREIKRVGRNRGKGRQEGTHGEDPRGQSRPPAPRARTAAPPPSKQNFEFVLNKNDQV